jgi:hypothetical protein
MLTLRMRECDLVKYLYPDFLAPYALCRASRVVALLGLCNFVSVLLLYLITSLPRKRGISL